MSWSKKITILYLSFVTLIVTLVVLCFGQKVELESKDYYAQELKFQDKINAISNEKRLATSISHVVHGNAVILKADSSVITSDFKGNVNFFRPSDSSKDLNVKMNFVNNEQVISTSGMSHGVYRMQLSWESEGKTYFKEEVIFIN